MALGDPYISATDLSHRTARDDDGSFAAIVDAASRRVEAFTGRQFNKTTVASARRFRPVDWRRLPVDDFHTVTDLAVTADGTAVALDYVDPRPWNGIVNGQPGWPFYDLVAVNRSWSQTATILVTAQWGWVAVPEAIREATLDVATAMVYGGSGGGPVSSESIDGYSVSYASTSTSGDTSVPSELAKAAPYRRRRFGVA